VYVVALLSACVLAVGGMAAAHAALAFARRGPGMRGTGYAIMSVLMIAMAVAVIVVALCGPMSGLAGQVSVDV
jgi:hypothetical protein